MVFPSAAIASAVKTQAAYLLTSNRLGVRKLTASASSFVFAEKADKFAANDSRRDTEGS